MLEVASQVTKIGLKPRARAAAVVAEHMFSAPYSHAVPYRSLRRPYTKRADTAAVQVSTSTPAAVPLGTTGTGSRAHGAGKGRNFVSYLIIWYLIIILWAPVGALAVDVEAFRHTRSREGEEAWVFEFRVCLTCAHPDYTGLASSLD